jgi:protoporphyrinogen oxidase
MSHAIVGAGPCGLSAAVHLHAASGVEARFFGEAMSLLELHTRVCMLLRSSLASSHISDQNYELTLNAYQSTTSNHLSLLPHESIIVCTWRDGLQSGIVPMLPLRNFLP